MYPSFQVYAHLELIWPPSLTLCWKSQLCSRYRCFLRSGLCILLLKSHRRYRWRTLSEKNRISDELMSSFLYFRTGFGYFFKCLISSFIIYISSLWHVSLVTCDNMFTAARISGLLCDTHESLWRVVLISSKFVPCSRFFDLRYGFFFLDKEAVLFRSNITFCKNDWWYCCGLNLTGLGITSVSCSQVLYPTSTYTATISSSFPFYHSMTFRHLLIVFSGFE